MRRRRSRDEIVQAFRALMAELGRTPGAEVFYKRAGIKKSEVLYYWPRPTDLAVEAGALPNTMQAAFSDADVFADFARICVDRGRIPTTAELRIATRELHTRTHTVEKRFGSLKEFKSRFRAWIEAQTSPELLRILEFQGWDQRSPKLRRGRPAAAPPAITPPIRPFLPVTLQGLEPLSRGERPPFEDLTAPVSLLFERKVADAFRCLGFEIEQLGQGKGRQADCLAIARRDGYAVIIDAKARSDTYVLGTEDRKFFEYAGTHGTKLANAGLSRVYFVVVATSFRESDLGKLQDSLASASIRSVVFFTTSALLSRVADSIRERHRFSLSEFEKELFSSGIIAA